MVLGKINQMILNLNICLFDAIWLHLPKYVRILMSVFVNVLCGDIFYIIV